MAQVIQTPQAREDLLEIWYHIAIDNETAAERWLRNIRLACERLADFPTMGAERSDLATALRSWPLDNYLIFYKPLPDGIEVLRVLHGARDLPPFFLPPDQPGSP
jgi:toxin ParE1/3/4